MNETNLNYCLAFDEEQYYRAETYASFKAGEVHCDNVLEYFLARRLDCDPEVATFRHQETPFEYFCPEDHEIREAYFSFSVVMQDGSQRFLYVTSQRFLQTSIEEARIEAAECVGHDLGKFELWTEPDLFGPKPEYMRSLIHYLMDKVYLRYSTKDCHHGTESTVPAIPSARDVRRGSQPDRATRARLVRA